MKEKGPNKKLMWYWKQEGRKALPVNCIMDMDDVVEVVYLLL